MATTDQRLVTEKALTDKLAGINYSSGIYKVTTLQNGWTGNIYISRTGNLVEISIDNLVASAATAGVVYQLPVGLRPRRFKRSEVFITYITDAGKDFARVGVGSDGIITMYSYENAAYGFYGEVPPYTTLEATPTTMPGTFSAA